MPRIVLATVLATEEDKEGFARSFGFATHRDAATGDGEVGALRRSRPHLGETDGSGLGLKVVEPERPMVLKNHRDAGIAAGADGVTGAASLGMIGFDPRQGGDRRGKLI